mmetsp:Transcript_7957/g.16970  ORF Transcript_7957/g.16970 Transcript_7957/m.16970 type:complete len:91 (+) Transcript_7957:566-838(+)
MYTRSRWLETECTQVVVYFSFRKTTAPIQRPSSCRTEYGMPIILGPGLASMDRQCPLDDDDNNHMACRLKQLSDLKSALRKSFQILAIFS